MSTVPERTFQPLRTSRDAEFRSPVSMATGPSIPCLRSLELFGKSREILIEHGGGFYRLRVTHSNKLILTK
ncbi:MAG: hemin uptake protein HemP [Steroidobacteraceae bacterium]